MEEISFPGMIKVGLRHRTETQPLEVPARALNLATYGSFLWHWR
jgi:hypothetical protein